MQPPAFAKIFTISHAGFQAMALQVYRYQYAQNNLYRQFCDIARPGREVQQVTDIPFLPIGFFKSHRVVSGERATPLVFESSGTTGTIPSRHYVADPAAYIDGAVRAFEALYGSLEHYCILGLLPSYLERGASSLVYMVQAFMERSGHPRNGFFLHDHAALQASLKLNECDGQRTLLIGVTYALLDFAAAHPMPLQHTIVMETGGMKGRAEELVRAEVHERLKNAFRIARVHSEYGMTELLSQAYAQEDGLFETPPWMRVMCGEEDDPGKVVENEIEIENEIENENEMEMESRSRKYDAGGQWASRTSGDTKGGTKTGLLHVIDLANVHSCAFIATQDICRLHPGGRFEVLGRADHSDIRGCSLLAL